MIKNEAQLIFDFFENENYKVIQLMIVNLDPIIGSK